MSPIFLIGYMGSGKTTLGHGVEARTHVSFIDLDEYIEACEGKTIREIFAERGEEAFRKLERDALKNLSDREDILVACGGGTPCFFDNMELMNSSGKTVWLKASVERLHQRLSEGKSKRPLIANLNDDELREFIISSLKKRDIHYAKATHIFNADNMDSIDELNKTVDKFISEFL